MNKSISTKVDRDFELVGVTKKEGEFTNEKGDEIHYKNYYVIIKSESGIQIRAKVDRVFNDYVEEEYED